MIDTKIKKISELSDGVQEYEVQLSICMQMNLNLYVEPVEGDPDTYEDEERKYVLDRVELQELIEIAQDKAKEMQSRVFECLGYVLMGLTYADVHLRTTGKVPDDNGITDKPYEAEEDLVFLYSQLTILYDFVFEVKCLDA